MRLIVLNTEVDVARWSARYIVNAINNFIPTASKPFVLGLPMGGTPTLTYQYLIDFYNAGEVSFKHVVTFNMDDYVGLAPSHTKSYHHFMYHHFFNYIDIQQCNLNQLNGLVDDLDAECQRYENKIKTDGPINLFIGGVGIDGHIAVNKPTSS